MRHHILLVMVLMLSLAGSLSAQDRNSPDTLIALQPIGLVVKYGQVDGLEPAKRLTTLHLLEDRAKGWLKGAKVPLLESMSEADLIGRSRLVFTVTVKKPSDPFPVLIIEGRLYQRVRLARDAKKELELPTWSMDVVAPEVTNEMLFALFDKQLGAFTTAYRSVNPTPARFDSHTANPRVPQKANANALQGLDGVKLLVSLAFISLPERRDQPSSNSRLKDQAFSRRLETEAQNKFKQAGITLLRNENERPGRPHFEATIIIGQPFSNAPAFEIGSGLWQGAQLADDSGKTTYVLTWGSHGAGAVGTTNNGLVTEEEVLKLLNTQLDQFIAAYKAANP